MTSQHLSLSTSLHLALVHQGTPPLLSWAEGPPPLKNSHCELGTPPGASAGEVSLRAERRDKQFHGTRTKNCT